MSACDAARNGPGPLNLGQLGTLPIDINTAFGLMDFYGVLTGTPNPAAVTDAACGQNVVQVWINAGTLPSGLLLYLAGVGFDPAAPNTHFDIANSLSVVSP